MTDRFVHTGRFDATSNHPGTISVYVVLDLIINHIVFCGNSRHIGHVDDSFFAVRS
jgi:hypothetical protein